MPSDSCDLAIIGAGAAGLAAAIFAGEAKAAGARFVLLEGERRPGAKILASGGGRCKSPNSSSRRPDYCGGSLPSSATCCAVLKSPRRGVVRGVGVPLRLGSGWKVFPRNEPGPNGARGPLLGPLPPPWRRIADRVRVHGIRPLHEPVGGADADDGFLLTLARRAADGSTRHEKLQARRVILATGGLAMPRSGSDGAGLAMARRLGHVIVPTTPALCPLVLAPGPEPGGRFAELAGVSLPARLTLWERGGKRLVERTGSLCLPKFGSETARCSAG
jgi:predicted flavoprotein YhiN